MKVFNHGVVVLFLSMTIKVGTIRVVNQNKKRAVIKNKKHLNKQRFVTWKTQIQATTQIVLQNVLRKAGFIKVETISVVSI